MEDATQDTGLPEAIQRMLSLALTIIAALLYAAVLGSAIIRAALESAPEFSDNTVRAAGLLSGLVGSVVTAGFARSPRPGTVQLSTEHPMGGATRTAWTSLAPLSLIQRNLLGLASIMGLGGRRTPSRVPSDDSEKPAMESKLPPTVWVALLYFTVYFLVGISAFLVAIWKEPVPEFIANSGWVWAGTVISAAYAFLGLNASE